MENQIILATKQLTKKYGDVRAVEQINLNVKKGRIYGLLGRNGAGKTTIMKMVLGLISISSGEIEIFGEQLKGNEKNIQDWDDLTKSGVEVITPDPKSSGGACWNFLAAWYYADKKFGGDEKQIKDFMTKLYANVSVMDSGARGATTTFVENKKGDVLIAWENEALLSVSEYPDDYEMITPSISIKAEPSVAIVDENADKNGTQEAAKEYLNYLYSDEAQKLAGENYYRPSNEEILKTFSDTFDLSVDMCTIDDFGGWDQAYKDFFEDDAIFDEINPQG